MGRPALTERRKAQTRREIAEAAVKLFARDGYEAVGAGAIAAEAGVSLRTFYHYFSAKDDVLSPIVLDGISELMALVAARPAAESLAIAFPRAYRSVTEPVHPDGPRVLIRLLTAVPALRARWLNHLRAIEEALVPVVQQRAGRSLTEEQAQVTAAAIVAALRIALERSIRDGGDGDIAGELERLLDHLGTGAGL